MQLNKGSVRPPSRSHRALRCNLRNKAGSVRILCTFIGAGLCVITVGCASRNVMPVTQGAELDMFAVALDTLRATQRVPVRVDPRVLGDDTIPYPGRVTV